MARRRRHGSTRWREYVPVAARRDNANRLSTQLAGEGRTLSPVTVKARGNKIAGTFWGVAWCQNLERFSDYSNRLPRGRTYVRNGSVIDLQVTPGKVSALVSGSDVYRIEITVTPMPKPQWQQLCNDCVGDIHSLVELLQGRFADGVMETLCRAGNGLFPEPAQIKMRCSCPDWATMCKHVAAVLYGVGARLDTEPQLLFELRQVDHQELVSRRDGGIAAATVGAGAEELVGEDLGALFGIDLDTSEAVLEPDPEPAQEPTPETPTKPRRRTAPSQPKAASSRRASTGGKQKRAPRDPWLTAAELRQRGIPNHVVQGWLNKGQLTHSGERGIYVRDDGAEALVEQYLLRAATGPKQR